MIPFAETYKGFVGKRNVLLETYNISKNDVVEKKRCFTVAFPYFPTVWRQKKPPKVNEGSSVANYRTAMIFSQQR